MRIRSDGGGEYVNGAQSVTALIDSYGNLDISVGTGSTGRSLTFDYSVPGDPANTFVVPTGQHWFRIKSNKSNNANPGFTAMATGSSGCYNVTVAHGDGVTQVQDWFNTAANPQGTYALVTRTTASSWSVTVGAGCSGTSGWGAVHTIDQTVRKASTVFRGYWVLPFAMSIRSL